MSELGLMVLKSSNKRMGIFFSFLSFFLPLYYHKMGIFSRLVISVKSCIKYMEVILWKQNMTALVSLFARAYHQKSKDIKILMILFQQN